MQINLNFDNLDEYNQFVAKLVADYLAVSSGMAPPVSVDVTPEPVAETPEPVAEPAPAKPKKPRKPRKTAAQKKAEAAAAAEKEAPPAPPAPEAVAPAGDAPTPSEIRAAMDAYLAANGSPALMEKMGAAGVGGGKRVTDLPVADQLAFIASLS